MTHQIERFDTVEALVKAAKGHSSWASRDSRSLGGAICDFAGSACFDDAAKLALEGWPDGLRKMRLALDAVTASATALGPAPAYLLDVAGAYPIPALAAAGDAFCMVNPAPISERVRPILRLVTSVATGSWATAEQIFNYGAGLVATVDALESNGFSVELTSARVVTKDKHRATILTRVKGAGEAVDLERLAFCLGHASYNRRVHFGVLEALFPDLYRFSYGSPQLPERGQDVEQDCCVLPPCSSFEADQLGSPEAAFAAMAPKVQALLADRFSAVPEIIRPQAA